MRYHKFLAMLLITVFLIVFFSCSYLILKDYFEAKDNDVAIENLIEETIELDEEKHSTSIDWDNLKSINQDIIGWIEIEDTKINYPILKDDKLFYLKHSYNKKYNSNGSIFTTNTNPFEDEETIIYGHNTKNGSMFSSLSKYLDNEFFYSHLNLKIYTPTQNYVGIIFSAYSTGIETESNNIKKLSFNERIKYYKESSKYTIDNVDNPKKIIKLSTCSYINAKTRPTDQRYYIVASMVPIE